MMTALYLNCLFKGYIYKYNPDSQVLGLVSVWGYEKRDSLSCEKALDVIRASSYPT